MSSPEAERFAEIVAKWQERLLQLDPRNRLLYFKPGKTAVRIVDQTPEGMMQVLLSTHNGLTFDYAEPRSRSAIARSTWHSEEDQEPEPYLIPGDLRGDCSAVELQRRLGNLRR